MLEKNAFYTESLLNHAFYMVTNKTTEFPGTPRSEVVGQTEVGWGV